MNKSPVVHGKKAKWYAQNYLSVEDDVSDVFEKLDTPFLDKRLKSKMRILDAMMGQGRHAIRYAKRTCLVHGNDLNKHMVKIARNSAKKEGLTRKQISFSNLDATSLKGLKNDFFDVTIAMFSSIGTIPNSKKRQQAMNSFVRVTKKDGLVMVHAHNFLDSFIEKDFFWWAIKGCLNPSAGLERGDVITEYNGLDVMFNHFYTPNEFRKSMEKAGLKVIEEHYLDYEKKRFISGPLKKLLADGFIFVGKKV